MNTQTRKSTIIFVLIFFLISTYFAVLFIESDDVKTGHVNPGHYDEMLSTLPLFSHAGGYYTEQFSLNISTKSKGTTIYYTLDGSEPTMQSTIYTTPILVKNRHGDPNELSAIPLNDRTDYLQWKAPLTEVFKGTVVRAMAVNDKGASPIVTHSYFIDEHIATKYPVSIISITMDKEHLYDGETGLFVNDNFNERGLEWERPAHFEFFEPDGSLGFAQNLGIRVHGGATRQLSTKSLRIYARDEYGKKTIDYQLFPDKPQDVFERFILRYRGTNFKDEFQAHLVKGAVDLDMQFYRPVVVFINGEYWGVYTIRDRLDDNYLKTHHGIRDIDLLTDNGLVSYGDNKHYEAMLSYIAENEANLNDPGVFEHIKQQMDVDNFRDLTIIQNFIMNVDQPGKNMDFWRSRTIDPSIAKHDGRWRWMLYDLDMGFGSYAGLPMNGFIYNTSLARHGSDHVLSGQEMAETIPKLPDFAPSTADIGPDRTFLLRSLLKNDSFRLDYLNRYNDLLNSVFKPSRVLEVIEQMKNEYAPLVEEDTLRVGVEDEGQFEAQVNALIDFALRRPSFTRSHAVDYFPEVTGTATLNIEADETQGTVIVNTLEINENLFGVEAHVYPWEGIYFTGIPIEVTAVPKPGYTFVGWEGASDSKSANLTITLTEDVVLRAVFE